MEKHVKYKNIELISTQTIYLNNINKAVKGLIMKLMIRACIFEQSKN